MVTGYCITSTDDTDFCIIRYNPNGRLDKNFGINDIANFDIRGCINKKDDKATNILLQSDRKIIVTGYSPSSSSVSDNLFTFIRLNTDGSLDTTYANFGLRFFSFNSPDTREPNTAIILNNKKVAVAEYTDGDERFAIVIIQIGDDDKIVISGTIFTGGDFHFLTPRLNSDGTLDLSFSDHRIRLESF